MKEGFITLAQQAAPQAKAQQAAPQTTPQTNAQQAAPQTKATVQVPANGAAPAPEEQQSPLGGLGGMIPMVIIMAVLIYFMWRGQKKEQKRRQEMIDGVKVGDKVVTIGGIYGEIVAVREQSFIVKIADNTRIELMKSAVSTTPAGEEVKK